MNKKARNISIEIIFHIINTFACIILMYVLEGPQIALSSYVKYKSTEFIFKYWIFTLSLGAARSGEFKYTAFPLMGIGMFDSSSISIFSYTAHYISAILFFIMICRSFLVRKRDKIAKIFGLVILIGCPIVLYSIYLAELVVVFILVLYLSRRFYRLMKLKHNLF